MSTVPTKPPLTLDEIKRALAIAYPSAPGAELESMVEAAAASPGVNWVSVVCEGLVSQQRVQLTDGARGHEDGQPVQTEDFRYPEAPEPAEPSNHDLIRQAIETLLTTAPGGRRAFIRRLASFAVLFGGADQQSVAARIGTSGAAMSRAVREAKAVLAREFATATPSAAKRPE